MGIKNKDGETPGQILGWGPPWGSAAEEEEDQASQEHQWRQKLQAELEDEWQEAAGRLEGEEAVPTHAALPSCRCACTPCTFPCRPLLWPCDLPMASPRPPLSHPPKQTMLPMRPRNPSPSQPGQIAWPGSMPRSASSSVRPREPARPPGLRAPVSAGGGWRRSGGSSKSGPGPRRRSCGRAEPGGRRRGRRRLTGTRGPGPSNPGGSAGAISGASVMCPGPALGEGTRRPWQQPWWPGVPPWRSKRL